MIEQWKDVLGYEGLYQVSDLGNVRSLDRLVLYSDGRKRIHKGTTLKPTKQSSGYMYIILYNNQVEKCFRLHRLVYEAFNGKIPEGMQVNHIDENKINNCLDNLNLMTAKDNINHGTCIKRRADKRSKRVGQFTLDGKLVKEWESIAECHRNGFIQGAVSACCRGERKTYKGFIWKFCEIIKNKILIQQ